MALKKEIEQQIYEICGCKMVEIKPFVLDGTSTIAVTFEESFKWRIEFIPEFLNRLGMTPASNEFETDGNQYGFEVLDGSMTSGLFPPAQGN